MAKIKQNLTPVANQTPVVVKVETKELSGSEWISRFPGSNSTSDLIDPFRGRLEAFIGAMRAGGAQVSVAATFRPVERAYLMHWAWCIVRRGADPTAIPPMKGVNIRWDHTDTEDKYSKELSVAAAEEMLNGYQMQKLRVAPALESQHTARLAIDMGIRWNGNLVIVDAYGETIEISTEPRTGMNKELHVVGAGYGVIKFNGRGDDFPHWSSTGA